MSTLSKLKVYITRFFPFRSTLLRYNLHTIECPHFNCTVWVLTNVYSCELIISVRFINFHYPSTTVIKRLYCLKCVFNLYKRDIFVWYYILHLQHLFPIGFDVIIISGGVILSTYPVFSNTFKEVELLQDGPVCSRKQPCL